MPDATPPPSPRRLIDAAPPKEGAIAPLTTHDLFWSPKSDVIATVESWGGGPPSGTPSLAGSALVVVEASTGKPRARHAAVPIFGFRSDGEWLVVGSATGSGIEEWSPRTGATRPSDFAHAVRGARAFCLAPDDRHLLVLRHDGDELLVRARDAQDEISLEGSLLSSVATDCAFAPDSKRVALSFPDGIIVYSLVDDEIARTWRATFPLPKASHLTWSSDGNELAFVGEQEALVATNRPNRVAFRWRPKGGAVRSVLGVTPGVIDRAGGMIGHDGCGWVRVAPGSTTWSTYAVTDPNGICAMSRPVDVVRSPNGRFVATLIATSGTGGPLIGRIP